MNASQELTTDYLVVGAGAAGKAFTDELLSHSDATVTIVHRRHAHPLTAVAA
jgi:UDP-galactopyranose mutase